LRSAKPRLAEIFSARQEKREAPRIGEKLNRSHEQVRRDVEAAGGTNVTPAEVTGADGKSYPATKPATKPSAVAENPAPAPITAGPLRASWCAARSRIGAEVWHFPHL